MQMMQSGGYAIITEFELMKKHNKNTNISEQMYEIISQFYRILINREAFSAARRNGDQVYRIVLTRLRFGSLGKFFKDVNPALFSDR